MPRTSDFELIVNGAAYAVGPGGALVEAAPRFGGMIRFETRDGMFSADALCAAAMLRALRDESKDTCVVYAECSGLDAAVPVVVNPPHNKATAALPVPELARLSGEVLCVTFCGTVCAVGKSEAVLTCENARLAVVRDDTCAAIRIWRREAAEADWKLVFSDGLAAASAAIDCAEDLRDGVLERGVGMQGGDSEIGISKQEGRLKGVAVCSTVLLGDAHTDEGARV
ncbi:MAG: hypothetical protein IJ112_03115 [Oscillospiraceae bacterium]|nr:hypothetical protein [Oscillospiraceae bacterium]